MWKINDEMVTLVVIMLVVLIIAILISALADKGVHTLLQLLRF